MTTVQLRDIVTEDDVEAVTGLRRGPGKEGYLSYGFVKNGDVKWGGEELMSLDLAGRGAVRP